MSELESILRRLPSDSAMKGFSVGAVSFSGEPASRKAIYDLTVFCRVFAASGQNDRIQELGRLIQKAHAAWVAAGAPGADD